MLPGLFAAVTRNRSRGNDDLTLFESGSGSSPMTHSAPHRAPRSPSGPRRLRDCRTRTEPSAGSRGTWRGAVPGCGAADGRRGEPVDWTHPVAFVLAAAEAVGLALERRSATRAPWHPGRCAEFFVDDRVAAMPGSCTPTSARAFDLPLVRRPPRSTSTPHRALHPTVARCRRSRLPAGKGGCRADRRRRVPAAAVERALRSGAGHSGVADAVRRLHRPSVPRATRRWPSPCASGPRPYAHRRQTAAALRCGGCRSAEQPGAVQRTL